jgi:hypothetical protein
MPKILRDTQKDCGKPGCLNDYRTQVLAPWRRDDRTRAADFRNWHKCEVPTASNNVRVRDAKRKTSARYEYFAF